ncbi:MAG: hypothetical protein Q4A06_05965 [Cardiobacteriaceae bacterium]|nr:hypothetical protein [Cardiobacteriaceae bacterium]
MSQEKLQAIQILARCLTNNDPAVLQDIDELENDLPRFFARHEADFEDCYYFPPTDYSDDEKYWDGIMNSLRFTDHAQYFDWKEGLDDFLERIARLPLLAPRFAALPKEGLNADASIPEWADVLNAQWQAHGIRLVNLETGGDDYLCAVAACEDLDDIRKAAKMLGERIWT